MRHTAIFAVISIAVLLGCGSVEETSTTVLGGKPRCAAAASKGAVGMTLGARDGDTFTAIRDGDPLVIIDGRQGGTWVMPSLRLQGTTPLGTVRGGITLGSGEEVGALPATSVYADATDGGELEVEYVPIPIGDNPDGSLPDGVAGSPATVRLSFSGACGEAGDLEVGVVLVYEPG